MLDKKHKIWTENRNFRQKNSKIRQNLLTENQKWTIPNLLYCSSCWSSCSWIISLPRKTSITLSPSIPPRRIYRRSYWFM